MNIRTVVKHTALPLFLSMAVTSTAQNFNLSKFTNASGLPQNYVYSVVQDNNGFVWVGMGEGLSRYDGLHFTNYSERDSLADNYVSKMIIDTDGRLWCGHGNGQFTYNDGRKFIKLPEVEEMSAPIKDMCLDDRGNIWAVEQNMGIVKITPEAKLGTYFNEEAFGSRMYTSICAVNSMTLLVGTMDGLLTVKVDDDGTMSAPTEVDELVGIGINCITRARRGNDFWIATNEGTVFRYSPINGVKQVPTCDILCSPDGMPTYDIRSVYEDDNGDLYLGTWGDGMKKWEYRPQTGDFVETLTLSESNGLGNNYVSNVMVDREGIFWFATYGSGLVAWINNYFAQYNLADIGMVRTRVTTATEHNGRLWMGLNGSMIDLDTRCMSNFDYYDKSQGLPEKVDISCVLFDDTTGVQYVGTRGAGVYVRKGNERKFSKLNCGTLQSNQMIVNGLASDSKSLYMATHGGLIVRDHADGSTSAYSTEDGLPHNNINFVRIDHDGQLWLGPKDGGIAMLLDDGTFDVHRLADVPVDVADMTEDDRGRFWLATVNNGILCTSNDSVVSITTADGLEKNYCFGIEADANGHIWVCHQPGLSCIDLNNGNIRAYNTGNGMSHEFTGVSASGNGDLWFSSSQGVVHYIGAYDTRNSAPPMMNLTGVKIDGKPHDIFTPIDLPYPYTGESAKLEFDFVGICMKDQRNVRYEYWLQNVNETSEPRWMPLGGQTHKEFDYLPEGDYILNVRAFNSSGIVSQRTLKVNIHLDKPFWRMIWFPIVALFLLAAAVRSFAMWRERRLRKRQEELEAEVARQTKEISDQKNEIERKNKDITGSITYANRIQTAVLPSMASFNNLPFGGTFLLFRPRDIVSGDFYWFNMYGDHALICCADCTGHGVPGAFMTLIGTTILNDATRDPENRTPSRLLERLDAEVKQTLNKNQSVETRDGMDCAIIDVDMKTGVMISAAAKRPIYVIRKGQSSTIKATRRAIGDVWNDNEFLETTTQLQDGDCIYLSSDGYVDQLGNEPQRDAKGKLLPVVEDDALKFSTKRFVKLLESISDEPMEEQLRKLTDTYNDWRSNIEAVDDVIVMGLRYTSPKEEN